MGIHIALPHVSIGRCTLVFWSGRGIHILACSLRTKTANVKLETATSLWLPGGLPCTSDAIFVCVDRWGMIVEHATDRTSEHRDTEAKGGVATSRCDEPAGQCDMEEPNAYMLRRVAEVAGYSTRQVARQNRPQAHRSRWRLIVRSTQSTLIGLQVAG